MKMNVLPASIDTLPHACFLGGTRCAVPIGADTLRQSNVGDDGTVFPQHPDVRTAQSRGDVGIGGLVLHLKVVLMKRHSLYQEPNRLWFKSGQVFRTQFRVGLPVAVRDGVNELLREVDDFLFRHD